ncbi:hypothetical protein EDD16DRAFT_1557702 [Pisolithus croceorrhizus]|nr:hypothetical protein EDD16DRAFT_1557702 [Pisolithus croceorrhizus]KAI6169231.1 hypothetical protein EDD17DRAFT_1526282 [Pisolithus thermaeus]
MANRFKLVFFCPRENTEKILGAIFARHPEQVGKIGEYRECAFITGVGQCRPTEKAKPTIGEPGQLGEVIEHRVEVLVIDKGDMTDLRNVISDLKDVHPYQEVAYDVYRLENV